MQPRLRRTHMYLRTKLAEQPVVVQVMPVELPGRNTRIKEAKPACMRQLVRELAAALLLLLRCTLQTMGTFLQ